MIHARDLFDQPVQPTKRRLVRREAAGLVEVLLALRTHRTVAWVERINTGAIKVGDRFVRFGFVGCPDVLGQLRDGRFLGVEVKAPKGELTDAQGAFLERIRDAGGVAFVARDLRDVRRELDAACHPLRVTT